MVTPELIDEVPARALAIFAHPDDPDVACGGTLARWVEAGSEVHVVLCTLGDKGTLDPAVAPEELVEQRRAEVAAAGRILGVSSLEQLGRRDGEVVNDLELREALVRRIRAVRPDALICPDPVAVFFGAHYYNHRDHRVVGFAALDAASPSAGFPLYFPGAGQPWSVPVAYLTGSLDPDVAVEITSTIEKKVGAVLCHESQLGPGGDRFAPVVQDRAAEAGRSVGVAYAEPFRRIRFAHV